MMAEHGALCSDIEASYCMNGGLCYKIPSMDTLSCVCSSSYIGSRCEQFQLLRTSSNTGQAGLITAVVLVVIIILIVLAVVIYYACKTFRSKPESQQRDQQPYWRVKSRA